MNAASHLPPFHVVGFSGHRELEDAAGVSQAITAVLAELVGEAADEWIAVSSVARGADMLFAQAALNLNFGWEALLPLPLAEFERDFPAEVWSEVKQLLARAEYLEIANEPESRDQAYLSCGIEVVNHADVLLAVWNGQPARGAGGTAEVVAYARAVGRPLIIIDPATREVRRENFSAGLWRDALLAGLNRLPETNTAVAYGTPRERVAAFQDKLDAAATRRAPQLHRLIAFSVWLHVAATGLATASLSFGWHAQALPWGKLLCLLSALAAAILVRYRHTQHHWIRCRLAAEFTRSILATWGLPRTSRLLADFDWPGLEPLRRSLDVLHRRAIRHETVDFDLFKQRYLRERIDDQRGYFARQEARATPLLARLRFGFGFCSVGAILFTAAYALQETFHLHVSPAVGNSLFYFAPIMLPVLAAAFLSIISIYDLHRRVSRYREICLRLELVRNEISVSPTWAGLERAITKAERMLLQEVLEWHSISSFTESH